MDARPALLHGRSTILSLIFALAAWCLAGPPVMAQTTQPAGEITPQRLFDEVRSVTRPAGTEKLVDELNTWCRRIAQDGRHYGPGAMLCEDMNSLAWFEGQTVWTIASAMPLLDAPTAGAVKAYLKREVEGYLLKDELYAYEQDGRIDLPEVRLAWKGQTAPRWEAMYGLWAYAHYCDDWPTIERNWPFIQRVFRECKAAPALTLASTGQVDQSIHSELAGLIGYYRMAKRMNDSLAAGLLKQAESRLPALLERADWPMACAPAAARGTQQPHAVINLLFLSQFNNMTPEAARYLSANRRQQAETRIRQVEEVIPFWWMSTYNIVGGGGNVVDWAGGDESMRGAPQELKDYWQRMENKNWASLPPQWALYVADNRVGGSEGNFQDPMFATQVFQAKALVLMDSPEDLLKKRPWINEFATMPWYRDMGGLANLVSLIVRHGAMEWRKP